MASRSIDIVVQSYLVQDAGSDAQATDTQELAHAVETDHSELLKIVNGLSSVLTSDDDEYRAKGAFLPCLRLVFLFSLKCVFLCAVLLYLSY